MLGRYHWLLANWFERRARIHTRKAKEAEKKHAKHRQLSLLDWGV